MQKQKNTNPNVLIGLSVFLALLGGMAMNPAVSFICFIGAGIIISAVCIKGTGWRRYTAFIILIIVIALAAWEYPKAVEHLKAYKSRTTSGSITLK